VAAKGEDGKGSRTKKGRSNQNLPPDAEKKRGFNQISGRDLLKKKKKKKNTSWAGRGKSTFCRTEKSRSRKNDKKGRLKGENCSPNPVWG